MATTKLYTVAGILVEATKSEGSGFYEITVVKTGQKQRYIAEVFETVAKPFNPSCGAVNHIPGRGCADCREELDK